jgi:integrase/recombinase XerD
MKYYYENLLANQNVTAKTNIAWVADITTLKLIKDRKVYVFLCIDIHTNYIVSTIISSSVITSQKIIRSLEKSIKQRITLFGKDKLIIHTDRGTQFSSKAYNTFVTRYNEYFCPSMARENTPTDNSVAERFMRTFKEHKIYETTIEEKLSNNILIEPNFRSYRSVLNEYTRSLNSKPNKKSITDPQRHYTDVSAATSLMKEPKYTQARSAYLGEDFRINEVEKYKAENAKVIGILTDIAARKAELVEKTPFDNFENNIVLQVIDSRLNEIYEIISNNPQITKQYVEEIIEPVEESLNQLHNKVDQLLRKDKKHREILPLRDPINMDLFPIFLANAGNKAVRQKDLKQSQLRLAYALLYFTGLRINEIRVITEKQILDAISSAQFNAIHYKNRQAHSHVLSKTALKSLKQLALERTIIFQKYGYKYLFGKHKPIHQKSLIRLMNGDLNNTCNICDIPYNIKSHSFRINMISNLLKKTTVQHAAQIIGHSDIKSTMSYNRYALSKEEIQELLNSFEN